MEHARASTSDRSRARSASRGGRSRNAWAAGASLLAIAGIVGAVLAAGGVARNDADRARDAFVDSSAEVTSALNQALLHEEDLIVGARGFLATDPDPTNSRFLRWVRSVQAPERYPELIGFGFHEIVPASRLAAYAARVAADPPLELDPGEELRVVPPGKRPYYCLAPLGYSRDLEIAPPAGFDYCATDTTGKKLSTRVSGQSTYSPIDLGGAEALSISIPVYRGGAVPPTSEARRATFRGWVGMGILPKVVLDRALQGNSAITATMRYRRGDTAVAFSSGTPPESADSVTQDLRNGWTLRTSAMVDDDGVLANGSALALLLAGAATSVLLALLVFVLGTGRARARRRVEGQTVELRHQALHDPLTDLPNRALIGDRSEQLLLRNRRARVEGAAMLIDLDEFKNVNDTLGHEAGDVLLEAVAERLQRCLRESDTLGRVGGDEFVVLVDGGPKSVAPELVAERLLAVMRYPFELTGAPLPVMVTASIGIAKGDRDSGAELLHDADVAMYLAKGTGKNRCEVFRPQMESDARHRYELEFELRSALEAEQFGLVYQPIYNLDDLSMTGVEALLRWHHPRLGTVPPSEFIPLLESSGHIVEVGRMVLVEACRQMAAWHARGTQLGVSVNVSARQLDLDVIVDHVREALELSGLDPVTLTIEITETALVSNPETTAGRLRELKAVGVQIAIDDFGTGYSSLAYLEKFPVDSLKIDRTFIDGITRSPQAKALVHTLVQLGRDLGLRTLAEGVERSEQLEQLRGERINEAQGFLLARPLDPETLEETVLRKVAQSTGDPA
jgi:diguanylate cyclase (GGDEF)-like protein